MLCKIMLGEVQLGIIEMDSFWFEHSTLLTTYIFLKEKYDINLIFNEVLNWIFHFSAPLLEEMKARLGQFLNTT